MTQYLVAIHHPDDFDSSAESEATRRDISALNREMRAAGIVVFVGGCSIAFLTTGNSTIQLAAPHGMRGRITSLWTTAFIGSTPIGSLVIGAVGQAYGGRAALAVGAVACVVAAVLGVLVLRGVRPPSVSPDPAQAAEPS